MILLDAWDLGLAALLVLSLGFVSWRLRLGITSQILIAALRTVIQLLLIGLILKTLFGHVDLLWVALIAVIMVLVAGREIHARQTRRFRGWWGFGMGTVSMFISSFVVAILALVVLVQADPWYHPRYAIPLLGMIMGNSMTGVSLAMDRLTHGIWQQRSQIEARLILGHSWNQAAEQIQREAMRSGMMPMINAMAAAGIVSLPGMMTGQILAGSSPVEAVKYQILVMFLITAGAGFGTLAVVRVGTGRLFDDRHRLRLDRLKNIGQNGN